jgi:hypothetical protein
MRFYKTSNRSTVLDRLDQQQQRTAATDDALEQFLTPAPPPTPPALTSLDAPPHLHVDPLSPKPAPRPNPNLSPFEKELLQAWSQD